MGTPIPENQATFSIDEIATATGAEVRAGRSRSVSGVSTDSRQDLEGKLFVALPGERYDGHAFVPTAVQRGAAGVLVERDVEVDESVAVFRVFSTLDALGRLAAFHRRRWGGTLVAVAGSAGKTTTRTSIAAVLAALYPGQVLATPGNLNNRIGVPMVLFGLIPEHRFAVLEIGTNQRGEVAELASVSLPDVAVLTAIGVEHAEGIGDLDAIEQEEGALLQALGPAGTAVANHDDPRCRRQLALARAQSRLGYGEQEGATYQLLERRWAEHHGSTLRVRAPAGELAFTVPLLGLPGAYAALAALAVAERLHGGTVPPDRLSAALAEAPFEAGRLVPRELRGGVLVLDDTYNSNPVSLRSSLGVARELCQSRGGRLVLVLGEMRELGALSRAEHTEIGNELAEMGASELIGVAGDASLLVDAARPKLPNAVFVPDAELAAAWCSDHVRAGDVVLVKGSRGVSLERVVERLVRERGARE